VDEDLDAAPGHQLGGLGAADVEYYELGAVGDVLAAAARQVIDYDHTMTLGNQGVGHVAADEARTARDSYG